MRPFMGGRKGGDFSFRKIGEQRREKYSVGLEGITGEGVGEVI